MPTHPFVISRLRVALGTFVAIDAHASSASIAERAIDAAFEAVCKVQRLMHPTRGTDLAALAACAPGTSLTLDPWTFEVLGLCARLHRASGGLFDPCLSTAPGRFADLRLLASQQIATRAPVHVDLGGIAKGYAVDRGLDALRAAGCSGGLVNAGGDLRAFGPPCYPIVCRDAYGAEIIVPLRDSALATSDAAQTLSRPPEHRGYYHGLDRTRAVTGGSVSVLAASASLADGLTKCVLLGAQACNVRLLHIFRAKQIGQKAKPNPKSKRVKELFTSNHW